MKSKPNIFYRIFILFFLLGTSGVFLFSFFTYTHTRNLLEETLISQTQESLHQIANTVEQTLQSLESVAFSTITDSRIEEVVSKPQNPHDPTSFQEIVSRMDLIATVGPPFTQIDLISFKGDWNLANNAFHRLTYEEVSTFRTNFSEIPRNWHQLIGMQSEYLAFVYPIPVDASEPEGALLIRIPITAINHLVSRDTDQSRFLVVANSNQELIFQNSNMTDFPLGSELAYYLSNRSGSLSLNLGSGEGSIAYIRSFTYGFHYFFTLDWNIYQDMLSATMTPTIVFSLIFLIFLLIIGYVVANHFSAPVATLSNLVSDNSKGDFKVINESVREIIVSRNSLQETVSAQTEQLKNLFMINLFYGILSEEEAHEKIRQFSLPYNWKELSVCTIQVDSTLANYHNRENIESLLFAINDLITESIPSESCLCPTIIDSKTQATILLHQEETSQLKESTTNLFDNIQKMAKEQLGVVISIGISSPFLEISKTRQAFKESREALKHRLKKGQGQLIFYDSLLEENQDEQNFYYPTKLTAGFLEHLKNGEVETAYEILNRIFSEIYSKNKTLVPFQLSILRLMNELFNLMNFLRIDHFSTQIQHDFYTTISEFRKPEEIEIFIKEKIIHVIAQTISDRKKNEYQCISEEILDIIQNEYDTDLTLENIANRLHYHPNYLSVIFKKSFNLPFSEYLSRQRHEMARLWLLETNITIKEISEKLQYTNSQNFIRSFRKIEGITPGQFRQEHAH